MRFIVIAFDGRVLDRAIHSLDLSVRPRMIDLCQPVFDAMLFTDAVKQMFECPLILLTSGKLNAVVSQNSVNMIRQDGNQLT